MPNNSKPTKPGGKHAVRAAAQYNKDQKAKAKVNRNRRAVGNFFVFWSRI